MKTDSKHMTDEAILRWAKDRPNGLVTVKYKWRGSLHSGVVHTITGLPVSDLRWFINNSKGILSITKENQS